MLEVVLGDQIVEGVDVAGPEGVEEASDRLLVPLNVCHLLLLGEPGVLYLRAVNYPAVLRFSARQLTAANRVVWDAGYDDVTAPRPGHKVVRSLESR